MKNKTWLMCLSVSGFLSSCYPAKKIIVLNSENATVATIKNEEARTDSFFLNLFNQYHDYFDTIIPRSQELNIQIIYTQVDRDANNVPKFTDYYYNVNAGKYFYPASTVKLPVAALALQRLNELESTGITANTTMLTDSAYSGQSAVYNDSTSKDRRPNISHYIKKIFLASDNDAFNRLYEFLGQQYINNELHKKGYTTARILHRLDIFLSEDENRHTNPIRFLAADSSVLYQQPLAFNQTKYEARNDSLGNAFYKNGGLVNMPMDFSKKNRIALQDLHNILRSLIFPSSVPAKQRFNLTEKDYKFIYQYMSQYPSETLYPHYDTDSFPDAYVKFLMHGNDKGNLPKNTRAFNKVGDAYGQMIDVAYIVDLDKKIEFFLSASINCNIDGIVNDDNYDYDTIGFPFMKNIGQVIYNLELKRKRTYTPDLSTFKIVYDK